MKTETIFPERKEMIYSEELEFDIDQRVWPEMKVVVFVQVRNTTLEQSRTFKVSNCPAHLVRSSWSESTVSPGTPVTLTVSSVAGSVCGVSAVDKSVELLGNGNTVSQEKVAELTSRLAERKVSGRTQEDDWYIEQNCPQAHQFLQVLLLSCNTFSDVTSAGLSELRTGGEDRPAEGGVLRDPHG